MFSQDYIFWDDDITVALAEVIPRRISKAPRSEKSSNATSCRKNILARREEKDQRWVVKRMVQVCIEQVWKGRFARVNVHGWLQALVGSVRRCTAAARLHPVHPIQGPHVLLLQEEVACVQLLSVGLSPSTAWETMFPNSVHFQSSPHRPAGPHQRLKDLGFRPDHRHFGRRSQRRRQAERQCRRRRGEGPEELRFQELHGRATRIWRRTSNATAAVPKFTTLTDSGFGVSDTVADAGQCEELCCEQAVFVVRGWKNLLQRCRPHDAG